MILDMDCIISLLVFPFLVADKSEMLDISAPLVDKTVTVGMNGWKLISHKRSIMDNNGVFWTRNGHGILDLCMYRQ